MMSDLVTTGDYSSNDLISFDQVAGGSANSLVGQRLKFSKGDWLYGVNSSEMKVGTRLICLGDTIRAGYIKWQDNRPAATHMSVLAENPMLIKREALGDTDQAQWELGMNGLPDDPWKLTFEGVFRNPDDAEDLYTFATSSTGGRNAMATLAKSYLSHRRMVPTDYPIVELGVSSYKHPNKNYGIIKSPSFEIIEWVPADYVTDIVTPKKAK